MAKQVKFYQLWSMKEIFLTAGSLIFFLFVIAAIYWYPHWVHAYKASKYDRETTALLLNLDEQAIIRQTKLGSRVEVAQYDVRYTYMVDGVRYEGTDLVRGTISNGQLLLRAWNADRSIPINYLSEDPSQSMIDLQ